MASRRHRRNPDRHLLIAHCDDLADLGLALALLPRDAYGAVIVEVPGDETVVVPAPSRMCVTAVRPGALGDAVTAWLAEWMPEERLCDGIHRMWVGGVAAAHLDDELRGRLHWDFERLDAFVS